MVIIGVEGVGIADVTAGHARLPRGQLGELCHGGYLARDAGGAGDASFICLLLRGLLLETISTTPFLHLVPPEEGRDDDDEEDGEETQIR